MYSGLVPAISLEDEDGKKKKDVDDYSEYFFWMFRPDAKEHSSKKGEPESFRDDTLLVWLNGGPGCSSMVGLMGENGPVTIPKFGPGIPPPNPSSALDAPLVENPYAWTRKSAMIYVEQPGGTGFSTASTEWTGEEAVHRTEEDVAQYFYDFLQNLYEIFGDELRKKKLYISGESYAGFYIPAIARGIYLRNKQASESKLINIAGVAIGNGWIDVDVQGGTTIDYAFWHGMIDLTTFRSLHKKWDECVAGKIKDTSIAPFHPYNTPDECGVVSAVMQASGSSQMYEVTTYDTYPALGDEGSVIRNFFNDPDIRSALNVESMEELPQWTSCVPGAGRRRQLNRQHHRNLLMLDEDIPTVVPYIAELVDGAKIDVLLYNGDLDLSCNPQSTELALESMEWSGKKEWMDPEKTPWQQWMIGDQAVGHSKKYNNLQFLVVYNSGHFVPTNQGEHSLNMIGRFIDGEPFGDQELPQFALSDIMKGQESLLSVASDDMKQKNTFFVSLLTGVFGFLLGVLASVILSKKKSSDEGFETETTSLLHSSRGNP